MMLPRSITGAGGPCPSERWSRPSRPTRRLSEECCSDGPGDSSVGPDDLLRLEDFNDAELLRGLWARYERREIYTWVGSVLVSVNPYSDVGAFKEEVLARYASSRPPQAPHLFAAVRAALSAPGSRHALLITGESGAGKTEATRAVLQFLAMRHTATDYIRDRLLRSTPVLEAFGNAHTRQNSNSSRFGKFIEVHLANDSEVIGATLQPYMLEASRVAGDLPAGERTYHVFYILRAALSALSRGDVPKTPFWQRLSVAPEWGDMISSAGELLKQSSRLNQGPKEARCLEWFEGLVEGLIATGMRNLEVAECMRIVAAVALLSDPDLGDAALKSAAILLRIEENQIRSFLTRVEMAAGNERIYRARTEREATTLRASVAQELYAALFSWLTRLVARGIAPRKAEGGRMLGLLDLYGFEVFPSNGFEQFLINYCNERLQQFFNRQVFTCEAEEYSAEGLDSDGQWKRLTSACQLPALALLEGQPGATSGLGIFGTINDRSRCNFEESLNGGSNASNATGTALAETLDKSYAGHPAFCRASGRDCSRLFGVKHFAGEVYYEAAQFVRKNASAHRPDIVHFLRENGGSFLREVVAGAATEETTATAATASGRRGRKLFGRTLISVFQQELNELCTTLEARQCRHIRCLRPNDEQKPLVFDDASMLRQCRYSGLLEATRIRKQGFAHRRPLRTFATRFAMLLRSQKERVIARRVESDAAASSACKALREVALKGGIDVDDIRVGLTKVFLRESALTWFETLRKHVAVTVATAALRGHYERQQYLRLRRANIRIQAFMRGCLARVQTAELRQRLLAARLRAEAEAVAQALALRRVEAALRLQTFWRQRCAWKQLVALRQERDQREQMFIESLQPAVHELPRPRLRPQEEQFHKASVQRYSELPEPVMVVCTSPAPSRSSDEDVHKAMVSPDNSSRWSGSTSSIRQSEVPSVTAGIRFGQVTMSSVPSSVVCRSRPLEPHELRTSIRAPVTVTSPRSSGLREQCLQECWQLITKLQSLPADSSPGVAADLAEVNEILSRRSARASQEDLAAIRDRLSQLKLAVDAPLHTPGTSVVLQRHPSYNSYSSSVVVPSIAAPRSDMQRSLSAFSVVRAQSPRSSLRPGVIVTPLGAARSLSAGRFTGVPPPTGGCLSARVHPQSRPSSYVPPATVVQASVVTPSAPNWVWNAPSSTSNVTATPIVAMPVVTKTQQASSIVASLPTPSRSTAASRSKALTARAQSPPATLQVSRPTSYVPPVVLNRAPGSPTTTQVSARSLQPSSQAPHWAQSRSTLGSSKSSIPLRKHRLQLGSPGPGRERSPARILFT